MSRRQTIQTIILRSLESGCTLHQAITENGLSVAVVTHLLGSDLEFQRAVSDLKSTAWKKGVVR